MATPGRRPKPTHLKVIEGNPGKRPLNLSGPEIEPAAPDMPDWISEYAKEEWARVVPQLERMKLIGEIDQAALVVYCEAVSAHRSAIERLNTMRNQSLIRGRTEVEVVKNPVLQIVRDQANLVAKMCAEFGMTASARARMVLPEGNSQADLHSLL